MDDGRSGARLCGGRRDLGRRLVHRHRLAAGGCSSCSPCWRAGRGSRYRPPRARRCWCCCRSCRCSARWRRAAIIVAVLLPAYLAGRALAAIAQPDARLSVADARCGAAGARDPRAGRRPGHRADAVHGGARSGAPAARALADRARHRDDACADRHRGRARCLALPRLDDAGERAARAVPRAVGLRPAAGARPVRP